MYHNRSESVWDICSAIPPSHQVWHSLGPTMLLTPQMLTTGVSEEQKANIDTRYFTRFQLVSATGGLKKCWFPCNKLAPNNLLWTSFSQQKQNFHLTLCMLEKIFMAFCRPLIFLKINFIEKVFPECHLSVKQFGSRSGLTFCQAWYGLKLFVKVIACCRRYGQVKS